MGTLNQIEKVKSNTSLGGCASDGTASARGTTIRFFGVAALRSFLVACLIAAGISVSAPAQQGEGGTFSHRANDAATVITQIKAVPVTDGTNIEVTASSPLKARAMKLSAPDRVAVDFLDVLVNTPQRIDVNRGPVLRVRAAQFRVTPRIARIVVDLSRPVAYRLENAGSKIVIKLSVTAGDEPAISKEAVRPAKSDDRLHRLIGTSEKSSIASPPPTAQANLNEGPPRGLLKIKAENKVLTVVAQNCRFDDVLKEITSVTGAQLVFANVDAEAALTRVAGQNVAVSLGPASPSEVVSKFLQGSGLDFVLIEPQSGLRTILLLAESSEKPAGEASFALANRAESVPAPVKSVFVTSPPPNSKVQGIITLSAVASSPDFVGLQFRLDGENLGAEYAHMPYSMQWNTADTRDGVHTVTATAHDATGGTITSAPITFTVSNGRP